MKLRKEISLLTAIAILPALSGCSTSQKTVKATSAKVIATTEASGIVNEHEWKITGKTSAPDGSKIVAYTTYPDINVASSSSAGWVKVKNGKFTAYIDPITTSTTTEKYSTSQKTTLHLAALTNYKKKDSTSITKKAAKKIKASASSYKLTMSDSQVNYYNSLDDSSESKHKNSSSTSSNKSSSSNSYNATDGENNAQKYSYGDLVKSNNFVGKSYHISKAEVLQAEEDDGQTVLLVYINDDPDDLFMVVYDGTTKAVEDDYVDIQGVLPKRQTYKTQSNGSNTVPSLVANKITVTGSDTE
ncbi:hypothetical protein [Lactiplantibacillus pentosus]|uniref:hypothetical protein n=1 Tax=Lactiplantibacillus pentosus TaxID=1589 RepID=UPI001FD6AB7F|nr:hypothetical protein [Lactiplantibacillus pentosus]MCJ8184771.1 hypothetical protein [Lactiplantibacillus pentosus]